MEAFLVSAGVVALAELGDKTQLLALVLAARFQRPIPVLTGLVLAVLANHTLTALAGTWIGRFLSIERLDWLIGLSFLGIAIWVFLPEKDEEKHEPMAARYGAFASTALSMFLAEMADRTQIATLALAARYETLVPVVLGTSLGMVTADLPAVLLGHVAGERLPLRLIRALAAAVFAGFGILILYRAVGGT